MSAIFKGSFPSGVGLSRTFETRSSPGRDSGTLLSYAHPFLMYLLPFSYLCAQGPVTEELVWRSCIIAIYHLAGVSRNFLIFFTPISFGAGSRPIVFMPVYVDPDTSRSSPSSRMGDILPLWTDPSSPSTRNHCHSCVPLISPFLEHNLIDAHHLVFQFTYTTLFGFHCAFLFLRTNSVFPPIAAHVFCNLMGVPHYSSEVQWHPEKRQRTCQLFLFFFFSAADEHTFFFFLFSTEIRAMYVMGIVAYILTMRYWTLVEDSLFWFASASHAW